MVLRWFGNTYSTIRASTKRRNFISQRPWPMIGNFWGWDLIYLLNFKISAQE